MDGIVQFYKMFSRRVLYIIILLLPISIPIPTYHRLAIDIHCHIAKKFLYIIL